MTVWLAVNWTTEFTAESDSADEHTVDGPQLGTETVARTVAAANGWSILMTDDDDTGGGGQNAVENGVKMLASGNADKPDVTIGRLSTYRRDGFINVWTSGNVCNDGSPIDGRMAGADIFNEPELLTSTWGSAGSDPMCSNGANRLSSDDVPPSAGADIKLLASDIRLADVQPHAATLTDGHNGTDCIPAVAVDVTAKCVETDDNGTNDDVTPAPQPADDKDDVLTYMWWSTMPLGIQAGSTPPCVNLVSLLTTVTPSQSIDAVPQGDDVDNTCVMPRRSLETSPPLSSLILSAKSSVGLVVLRQNRTFARCFISSSSFNTAMLSGSRHVAWNCDRPSSLESTANGFDTSASARANASSTSRVKLYSPFLPAIISVTTLCSTVLWLFSN